MKKNYLKPQIILWILSESDAVRTSPLTVETDNCESWMDSWSDASQGGSAE